MNQYPMLVYRVPGQHQCKGGTYKYASVNNDDELRNMIGIGWFPSLGEAINGRLVKEPTKLESIPNDDAPPSRQEIEAKLQELGIEYNPKLNNSQLLKKIDKALKGKD